jgi:N6-L-threonylcarbamoyladenine synthase
MLKKIAKLLFSLNAPKTLQPNARTSPNQRIVFAIETSCDDTCAAIVSYNPDNTLQPVNVISMVTKHQNHIHESYGGINPKLAANGHSETLPVVIRDTLKNANNFSLSDVDAIAVTQGPGLSPCLNFGLSSGKLLSCLFG